MGKALEKLLILEFGAMPADLRPQLEALTEEQLERYLARVLRAKTVHEVFAD